MDIIYTVLYTHQKTKKAKTWQDGTLKVLATGTKAILYDDKGSKLDALHVRASDVVTGEQLESDRYYIQVEEVQKHPCSHPAPAAVGHHDASNRLGTGYPDASNRLGTGYPDASNRLGTGYPDASNRLGTGYPDASNRLGTGYPDASNRLGTRYPDTSNSLAMSRSFSHPPEPFAVQPRADHSQTPAEAAGQGIGTRGSAGLKRKRSGFIPPRLVRPRPAEEEAPAPEPDFPGNCFYGNVKSANRPTIPDWAGQHANSVSEGSFFRGMPDNRQNVGASDRSSANLFCAVKRLSGDAACHGSTPSSAVMAGRDSSPAGEAAEGSMPSSFRSPGSTSPRLASATRNSAWRTFGSASSWSSPILSSHPPGGAVPSTGRDQSAGQELRSKWEQFSPDASDVSEESPSSASHSLAFPAGFVGARMEEDTQNSFPEIPLRPRGSEPIVKRSTSEIMALLGKKKRTSSPINAASRLSAFENSSTAQFSDFAPPTEPSHSDDLVPPAEPNRSNDIVPPAEPHRSNDIVPPAEPNRSNDIVPPAEPHRSNDIVPPAEPNRSNDIVPPAEPNRSNVIVPPAEPNRSNDIVPPAEPNRSNVIVPPAEPNRSNDIVPPAEPNRSNDIVPPAEPNRSNDIVPPAEPNRSNDIVPPAEPNRSNDIVPPAEPHRSNDIVPPAEPNRSNDIVPPAEPNRSNVIVPPAEPNRSNDIVPPAEPNRSNVIVPPAEPNRSNDIVPPAEPNRSNDIVPPAEPNRSNDIVPPAEPNRSNDIVPPAEPNRSNDIVPPAEPSHQAAHPDSSPESPTCHSSKVEGKKSHCMLSLRTRQHHSPRSPSDVTPDVAVPRVHAQTGSPHLFPDSHVQASSPASEQTTAVTLARKSSFGGSLCLQLSDDGACTSTLKPPLSDTPPRGYISDGQRTGGFKKSDENLPEFPSAVSLVHLNENHLSRSDLSHHSSPGDMKSVMSPRLSVSTPSLSKHDFEEEEGCFEEKTFSVKSVTNSSQCLSDFDFAAPDPGAETSCQPFSPTSKCDEVCPESTQIQDPVTEGCSFAVKKRQQSSDAAEDISACGKSESSVEQGRRGWESNARRLSDEAVSTQPNIEAQPRGEPETQPAENAEEQDLGACFEVSLSSLSEEAETDDEAFQNSEQDPGNSHEDDGGESQHPENTSNCNDQSLLVARETETVELPESSSEGNLAHTLPPEKQCSETVKESLDMDKAGVQTEGKSQAGQPVQHVSVVNENICDHVERLGGQDQVTGFVTECNTMGLMTEGSSSVKECTQSQLGKEVCEPEESAEVDDVLKKNRDAKENIDQSDLETEGDNCASSSNPEIMEAGDGQARQGDSLQTVSQTPDAGVSDAFDSRPKPVSLSQLSQSVSSQNVVDNMKTLNDLDISPDSFVHGQQFEKPPSEDISSGFVSGDQPYTLERKENTQHCGISEQVDAEKEMHVSWRQNQTLKGTAGEAGMLCHKEQNQVDATASSSFNRWSFSPDLVGTKLTTPSPPSFHVAGQSLSPDSDATEETCSSHDAAVSSSNTMIPRDQIHLPASYKRSAVPMHESMRNKVPRCSHSYSSGQNLSLGHHQNRPDDGDLGRRYSPPLPAPRIFQTVSEALGGREGDVPVLRPGSFCRGNLEDPTWTLQQDRIGSTELHAGRLDESCKHSNEGSGSGDHHHHQPMSSTLPHPDRLTRSCGLGLTGHRQGLDTTTDITQAISARLMDYKMQGMVSSDLVERPMAWRRGTDQGSSLLPWLRTQTELHGGVGSDGGTDFVRSMDAGAGFMSPYSRHQKLQRHAREAVCEGVASPSPDGEDGRQLGAPASACTPEARLSSPAGEVMETGDGSFFVDWADGKPQLARSGRNLQSKPLELSPNIAQQVPQFPDALTILKMSQRPTQHAVGNEHTKNPQCFLQPQRLQSPTRNFADNRNHLCEDLVPGHHYPSFTGDYRVEEGDSATAKFSLKEQPGLGQAEAMEKDREVWERVGTERCVTVAEERTEDTISVGSDSQSQAASPVAHPVGKQSTTKGEPDSSRNTPGTVGGQGTLLSPQLFSQNPHSFRNVSGAADDNWLSPQLFSQAPRSPGPACRSKPVQRARKLRPVLTAPDEIAKGARDAPAALANDRDKVPSAGDRGLATGQNTPCRLAHCTDTDDSADTSGGSAFNREMASHQPGCDDLDLPVSRKSVSDAVELMDFSGFEDSFPESDVQDEQLLAAEKAAMSGSSTQGQTSVTKQAKCGLGLKQECEGDGFTPLGDGRLAYTAGGCGVQQSGLVESCYSTNTPSSPAFVIADGALDYMHEEEEGGGSEQTSACRQDVKQEALPADSGRNSYALLQRQKKVSMFARQVQALHPRVNDQDKENHFRLYQAGQASQSETFIACKAALRPPAFNQSFGGNFLKLPQDLSDQDRLLAPSTPTDSPPMDLSPPGPSVGHAALSSGHCGDDSCKTLMHTASLALKKHSPYLPSWSHCKLKTPASQQGKTEVDRFPSSRFHGNCAQSQTAVPSWQPCTLDSGSTSERSAPSEAGATGPSDARGFMAPRKVGLGRFRKPGAANVSGCLPHTQFQSSLCQELQFFSREEVESQATPERQVAIPPSFDSVLSYRQVLTAALIEFVNIQLFGVAKTYHSALSKVDVSAYTEGVGVLGGDAGENRNPTCKCGNTSKVAQVKKEGPNKGRFFYACSGPREKQCKYFQWVDQHSGGSSSVSRRRDGVTQSVRPKFNDPDSIMGYFRGHRLPLYCQCRFVRRSEDQRFRQGFPAWGRPRQTDGVQKKSVLIKLPKKDSGTTHAKDDVWVVSKSLSFAKGETFVARSTFHGPNTHGEVAIDPMAGYSASQWTDGGVCHAIHCGNAATELSCMANLQEHVDMTSLPVLPHLLSLSNQPVTSLSSRMSSKGFKAPLARQGPGKLHVAGPCVLDLAAEFIAKYQLNTDQAAALQRAADVMNKDAEPIASVLLVHGVFGAGKSFLLSVLILFLVEVFQRNDTYSPGVPFPWKLLLSSTTNVAVDRVLQGLLELGFDDFVRVGSVKKIAKPVLPYSVHASGSESQELKDLQDMLRSQHITPAEKHCVRKSIERHKLGENRKRLGAVRVVGVTCAACSFQCLDKMQFPFVVLDECSQMTEPASLLPIARFACEKLVLVGDPKQLDPTLQGSNAAHEEGLEQTLLDRLMKMGHEPVMLRTQYRCHPIISAVSSSLFYQNQLVDGVTAHDRPPVLDLFPPLCFYDVSSGQEQTNSSGSFINEAEAQFVILLLYVLVARGLPASSVGVITLYKAQAWRIVEAIRGCRSVTCEAQQQMAGVQVSTVDAFQGGERDIIILSCVRTRSLGFIDSDKRMNVALTRARHHLLIVGHQQNLYGNKRWAQVISHCQGVEGGIVSASAAGRQLQAILDQLSGDRGDAASHASSTHTAGQHSDKPLRTARTKHKRLPQRASAENPLEASDAPSPAVSASSDSVLRTGVVDAPRPQRSPQSHQESSLAQEAAMEENLAAVASLGSHEGPILVVKQVRSSLGRSRVKPLVIDSENEEEGSSSDDCLPDGL